ncbi:serine--tRNA ligase [Desulfobacula toluolica]|uniref:Serine--tRNA ligase n=1 Tax=Desulfobacula toluolica (strain DSM 7467 / Tol2) TaxID=651182 RepID=K0ND93_DESTT|nr:serine--tRNA ligase [Desulfobacula toluolica]CCK78760.1 SerC: seryl-tRNA synthetase [Desulfobacula toluolica Tol2]
MLDLKYVKNNLEIVKNGMKKRNAKLNFASLLENDDKRKALLLEIEKLRHKRNVVSDEIAKIKKSGHDAGPLIKEMRDVSETIKKLDKELSTIKALINEFLISIPNIPHEDVPMGKDDTQNRLEKTQGQPKQFDFKIKPHWEIGENLGILDFTRAAKLTGARFPLYIGKGARLERALINFMLDIHTSQHGYTEALPPFIVNKTTMTGTGQLPKFEEDLFKIEGLDYYLIPTSEVPITNIYSNEILDESMLPCKFTAYTPCFRSEAGSYGRDTKGLIRQHQFNKVEMVKLTTPETSFDELQSLLANAEKILQLLELPYQVVTLCTGDLGFSATKTYDIEVWMPGQDDQGKYREISSCSNCLDFQARRANIRFRRKGNKKPEYVHTLNGSGLAVGRTFAAILENYQQADGSVLIPDALIPYMGGQKVIRHEA